MRVKTVILAALIALPLAAQQPQNPPEQQDPPRPGWQQPMRRGMGPGGGQGPGPGQGMGMQQGPRMGRGSGRQGFGPRGRMGMRSPRGAQGMMMRRGFRPGGGLGLGLAVRNPQFRERLGLTAEQVTRIEAGHSEFSKAQVRQQAEMRVKRMELAELMRADNPDRAALEKKMREVHDAEFAERKAHLDHQFALRDTLTPEQQQKLRELRNERPRFQGPQGQPGRRPMQRRGPGAQPPVDPPETEPAS